MIPTVTENNTGQRIAEIASILKIQNILNDIDQEGSSMYHGEQRVWTKSTAADFTD